MHYSDLNALLRAEPEAKHYFDTLPDYAREQINTLSRVVFILSTRMGLAFAQKNLRRGFVNAVIISTMFKNWTCSIWYVLAPGSVL